MLREVLGNTKPLNTNFIDGYSPVYHIPCVTPVWDLILSFYSLLRFSLSILPMVGSMRPVSFVGVDGSPNRLLQASGPLRENTRLEPVPAARRCTDCRRIVRWSCSEILLTVVNTRPV